MWYETSRCGHVSRCNLTQLPPGLFLSAVEGFHPAILHTILPSSISAMLRPNLPWTTLMRYIPLQIKGDGHSGFKMARLLIHGLLSSKHIGDHLSSWGYVARCRGTVLGMSHLSIAWPRGRWVHSAGHLQHLAMRCFWECLGAINRQHSLCACSSTRQPNVTRPWSLEGFG